MGDSALIAELRELFPVTRKWNYLYNGGIHACPKPVGDAMRSFIRDWEDGGRDAWPSAYEKFHRLKERFATLAGTEAGNIVVTDSTSSAINLAARILAPTKGQNVVLSDQTFMSDSYAWLVSHPEIEVRFADSRNKIIRTDDIRRLVDDKTLTVNLCAVTAGSGFRINLQEVYNSLEPYKPPLLIDASQALGVVKMSVEEPPLDFMACTAAKWLMGPTGVAFLYVAEKFLSARPPAAGWICAANNRDWNVRECVLHEDAGRFQGGIPNLVGVVGALAGLELIEQVGIDFIQKRVSGLVGYALEKLQELDLDLRTPLDPGQRAGLVFFRTHGSKDLYGRLQSAGIYCGCFAGGIRIDPNFYNTHEEIDQLISVVKKFKKSGLKNRD